MEIQNIGAQIQFMGKQMENLGINLQNMVFGIPKIGEQIQAITFQIINIGSQLLNYVKKFQIMGINMEMQMPNFNPLIQNMNFQMGNNEPQMPNIQIQPNFNLMNEFNTKNELNDNKNNFGLFLTPKINVIFHQMNGKELNIIIEHGKTIDELLKKYFKSIGRPEFINTDKILIKYNVFTHLNFGDTTKVETIFGNNDHPKVIVHKPEIMTD